MRNRENAILRNRETAESRDREIEESRNREIAESRNREIAESRSGIGNRNRKHATSARIVNRDLESEIAIGIGNRELEIGCRIANMPRQHRSWPSSSSPIGNILAGVLTRCDRESRVKGYAQQIRHRTVGDRFGVSILG